MIFKPIIIALTFFLNGIDAFRTSCNETSLPNHVFVEEGVEYVN